VIAGKEEKSMKTIRLTKRTRDTLRELAERFNVSEQEVIALAVSGQTLSLKTVNFYTVTPTLSTVF